jgi:hypothetical protein
MALLALSTLALLAQAPEPTYSEVTRYILDLEDSDVARLERQLAANPDDIATRVKLIAYHGRGDRSAHPEDRGKAVEHAIWLIEHHPESALARRGAGSVPIEDLAPAQLERARSLWAAAARSGDAGVLRTAAAFFSGLDPGLHLTYLEMAVAADSSNESSVCGLAYLYALTILEGGPLAARARAALDASNNVWVLGNAAYMLQSQHNRAIQMGAPTRGAAELAEHYLERALALDPNLDRKAILPQLDPQATARALEATARATEENQKRNEGVVERVRRLPPEAFADLPPAIAGALRARRCGVPQPAPSGPAANVIRGDFIRAGETAWAVLCSVNGSTDLLVFRNASDTSPMTVTTSDDSRYAGTYEDGRTYYAHAISPVDRAYITRHYRAYGGPEPPPIDHLGIDDAFLEKASVIWYFYQGEWLALQGAD